MLNGRVGEKKEKIMYEYVTRKEYQPVRLELEEIIRKVHHYMRDKHNLAFQHKLIGSGSRHLITRIKGGNKGFDFDYNFILPHPGEGYYWKASVIKNQFTEALKFALKGTKYSDPKDSTSAITIKVVDRNNSSVSHSCDFAIIYYSEDDDFNGYYYLKNWKRQNRYSFEQRISSSNIDEKLDIILSYPNGWDMIKDEYIKLKNRNKDINKRSFVLYLESVNNVYNQLPDDEFETESLFYPFIRW